MSFTTKYAPQTLNDVVMSSVNVRNKLDAYINGDLIQPLILHGDFGTGKSTIANLLPDAIEGKKAMVENLKANEFNTINDVSKLFGAPSTFYKLFTVNGQKRNYIISNEFNFTMKAALAFRDVVDDLQEHTQFIFTTNNLASIDKGIQDRSICLLVPPVDPADWLPRAKFILKQESVKINDAQLLNFLNKQLLVSNSNRKLLEELQELVLSIKNPKSKVAAVTQAQVKNTTAITAKVKPSKVIINNPLAAIN